MNYEENRKELANRMVDIEFQPVDRELAVRNDNAVSFPVEALAEYGGAAVSVLPALQGIAEAAKNAQAGEQLYRCVFPNGISGSLALAKDGSGALGTIVNSSGIAGQARWIPVAGAAGGVGVATIAPAVIC